MIIELILGWLIGRFVAKNKVSAAIMGVICGAVWGFAAVNIIFGMTGNAVTLPFLLVIVIAEAVIAALMACIAVHIKMQKHAKHMQSISEQ